MREISKITKKSYMRFKDLKKEKGSKNNEELFIELLDAYDELLMQAARAAVEAPKKIVRKPKPKKVKKEQ